MSEDLAMSQPTAVDLAIRVLELQKEFADRESTEALAVQGLVAQPRSREVIAADYLDAMKALNTQISTRS